MYHLYIFYKVEIIFAQSLLCYQHIFQACVRCRSQVTAICADVKEAKTTNSKVSAKQEDDSSPSARPHIGVRTRVAVVT
jgi:hypothetical protein